MLPSTSPREALFADFPSLSLGTGLPSLWNPPFPHHATAWISPFFAKVRISLTLTLSCLTMRTEGSVPFLFGKSGPGVLANCSLCGDEATLSFSAGPVCSGFSAEAYAILKALGWSRQHQQVRHFSSVKFSICPLLGFSFYIKLSGRSAYPHHQATMRPRTLVSPTEQRG